MHSDVLHRNDLPDISISVSVWVQVLRGTLGFREAQVVPEHQELKEAWEKWDYLVWLTPPKLCFGSSRSVNSDIAL